MPRTSELSPATARQIGSTCFCLHLQRAARVVARVFDDALRRVDLTNGQFALLTMVSRETGLAVGELAAELDMDRTTVTAYLKPLERRRLITLETSAEDRRSRRVLLTGSGRRLLGEAVALWRTAQTEIVDRTGFHDTEPVLRTLRTLAARGSKAG